MSIKKGANHFIHVFVYGTLKAQKGNHSLMKNIDAELIGYDSMTGALGMISYGGFPAVCKLDETSETTHKVYGELYRVPAEGLASLDALEGHPHWYRRERLRTDINNVKAWIYLMPASEFEKNSDSIVEDNAWRITSDEYAFWQTQGVELAAS